MRSPRPAMITPAAPHPETPLPAGHAAPTRRSCGDCTLCCKVYPVPVMEKPRNVWCRHCKPGKGCGIWQDRPEFCRAFHCTYILDPRLGPEWKPNVAKFVLNWATRKHLHVTVDPGHPQAYRREPYYAALKSTAETCLAKDESIIIFTGAHKYLMLPDGEHLIGPREEPMEWYVEMRRLDGRMTYKVIVTKGPAATDAA